MASTGAAIGTLVAELVVLIVQFYALRNEVTVAFKQMHYIRIIIALVLGTVASLWVKTLGFGSFSTLVLFFGVPSLEKRRNDCGNLEYGCRMSQIDNEKEIRKYLTRR